MKKLNRKGFTLIELLAIIVILAIIMVVTIPTVINSMDNTKEKQLQNAANAVAEYLQKQYDFVKAGGVLSDTEEQNLINSLFSYPKVTLMAFHLKNTGIARAEKNIESERVGVDPITGSTVNTILSYAYYDNNINKICVVLTAKEGGNFYVEGGTNEAKSSGCTY